TPTIVIGTSPAPGAEVFSVTSGSISLGVASATIELAGGPSATSTLALNASSVNTLSSSFLQIDSGVVLASNVPLVLNLGPTAVLINNGAVRYTGSGTSINSVQISGGDYAVAGVAGTFNAGDPSNTVLLTSSSSITVTDISN